MSMLLDCAGRPLDLSSPQVMGILNITPDSFSDGGCHLAPDAALRQAERMVADGAAILDVGGESTRPGAVEVSVDEELARVMPVIERLVATFDVPVSIDTSKPEVMTAAAAAGAGLINDVAALRAPGALTAAAATGLPVCLMHMQGDPRTMQGAPHYNDVVCDIVDFLRQRIAACAAAGIGSERLLLDPGFGFGKTLQHNLILLNRLAEFGRLGLPLLVGISRKSMLGIVTGRAIDQRVTASVAAALMAVERGARIVRAHDVAATVDALRLWRAVTAERFDDGASEG